MKKIFSFFAAMLVAVAVNAQTDFAAPGYKCAADDAVLTGGSSSSFYLKTDVDPHCVAWSDCSLSSNALATWTVEATRGCYVSVSLDLGHKISSNKHNFEVTIKDSKANIKGMLSEGGENADSVKVKALDGTILLPTEGVYTVEVFNNRDWGKGAINNVILTYAADAPSEIVEVEAVELNKVELALEVEEVELLVATVSPDNATDPSVTWESDNEEVAKVSETGLVQAIAEGTANIKAKAGEKEAVCAVTVGAVAVPDVDFDFPCVLSGKKAHLEGAIWKNDEYKLYGDGGHNKNYGTASWTINVTRACTVSGVLNGVEGGHIFGVDVYQGEELIGSLEQPEGKTWSHGEIALEGEVAFAAAGTYTIKLRNTQEWSSGKVAGITLISPKTLYLKPGVWYWEGNDEKFAVYAWADGKEAMWSKYMTLAEHETNIWTITIPGDYTDLIFVRFGNASTTPSWEDNMWNKTNDLKIEAGKNLYTITNWGEYEGAPCPGEWSKYEYIPEVPAKFYITGSKELVGESVAWNEKAIKVTEDSYTFENLPAGYYAMKVLPTGSWDNNKGYNELTSKPGGLKTDESLNVCFSLAEEGNVLVTYIEGEEPVFTVDGNFVMPHVALVGGMNAWDENANVLEPAEDKLTASVKVNLTMNEEEGYGFKIYNDGKWLCIAPDESGWFTFHREFTSASNIKHEGTPDENFWLKMDVPGIYTFTWTYAENKLDITFPAKDPTSITNTNAEVKTVKVLRNGMLLIEKNGVLYNAQGVMMK